MRPIAARLVVGMRIRPVSGSAVGTWETPPTWEITAVNDDEIVMRLTEQSVPAGNFAVGEETSYPLYALALWLEVVADATVDEASAFLAHVRSMVGYWASEGGSNVPLEQSSRHRLEGLAFSILVALDGGAAVGPYAVRPVSDDGSEGADIAGGLHEQFFEKPAEKPADQYETTGERIRREQATPDGQHGDGYQTPSVPDGMDARAKLSLLGDATIRDSGIGSADIASADVVLPLSTGETMILRDLLSHDGDMLDATLGYQLDAEVHERLRATLEAALQE